MGLFDKKKERKPIDEKQKWKINVQCKKCDRMEYENGIETHFENSDHSFGYPSHKCDFHPLYLSEDEVSRFKEHAPVFNDSIVLVSLCKICRAKNSHFTRISILDNQGIDYKNMPVY